KRGGRIQKHRPSTSNPSHLSDFFAKYYPDFQYDATESASSEFYRLCDESGWDRGKPERADAHEHFKDALVRQFNEAYGTDENNLGDWQSLCRIVHIEPVPDDLHTCREASNSNLLLSLDLAVRGTHVNLVDLVDRHTTGEEVQVFKSERKLSEYTQTNGKFFPKESAYAGGLLRHLLRHILDPAKESPSHRRIRKRR
ncbi:hypothetical protein J3R82DRAFT_2084, partial [Butyriboletus roseoflavus]